MRHVIFCFLTLFFSSFAYAEQSQFRYSGVTVGFLSGSIVSDAYDKDFSGAGLELGIAYDFTDMFGITANRSMMTL